MKTKRSRRPTIGTMRRDMRRYRIVVEFFVHDDPHLDPVPLHHRQQQGTEPFFQPLLADVCLLALREQLRHRRDRFVGSVLRKKRDQQTETTRIKKNWRSFDFILEWNLSVAFRGKSERNDRLLALNLQPNFIIHNNLQRKT